MAAVLAFGAGSLVKTDVAYAQASTVGQLRGVVKDKGTNENAVGATVVATSPALQGEQVVITDENGQYFVTSLPPGMYTLTVYYNDSTYARSNVLVQVGKEAVINITVNSAENAGKPKGEVINIAGTAPIVDQGSTKTGLTLTEDYTKNVPTGRTFGATMGAAAGSQGDQYGISFARRDVGREHVRDRRHQHDGHGVRPAVVELAERVHLRDRGHHRRLQRRVRPRDRRYRQRRHQAGLERVPRLGVRQPEPERRSPRRRRSIQAEGGSIDNQVNPGNIWDAGFELGGPIIKDKLWFHVGFDPSVANVNDDAHRPDPGRRRTATAFRTSIRRPA